MCPQVQVEEPGVETAQFTTTHWSVVLAAREGDTSVAGPALEALCRVYWYPLYAYVRRRGFSPHDAQDLIQGFFERLLEKHYLQAVDPSKGKFRSFLLAAVEHFLANFRRSARTRKRGGGQVIFSLDSEPLESRYQLEPQDERTPERVLERCWALTVLEQGMSRLRQECAASGKLELFEQLKGVLSGEKGEISYAAIGSKLGLTQAAVKMTVHRMRERYGQLLREEIAQTVSRPEDIDEEIRYLFAALS